jgi:uncharacterized protein (TIGR02466 family)
MKLTAIHVTPVAAFDASQFIDYANPLFDTVKLKEVPNDSYLTSLNKYSGITCEDLPNSEPLKNFIVDCAKEFFTGLGGDVDDYDFQVAGLWLNEMASGTYHSLHSHWAHTFSGNFYVNMPTNTGGINFKTPLILINKFKMKVKEYTVFNSETTTMNPLAGELLMWESHIAHEVPPSTYDGVRRGIGFDVDLTEKNT